MNTNTVAHDTRTRVDTLTIEHLIAIEHEQAARIADLESERDTYREMVRVLLDSHRKVIRDRDELRQQIDHWQRQARKRPRRRSTGSEVEPVNVESSWTH